jgi:hypothetical protein
VLILLAALCRGREDGQDFSIESPEVSPQGGMGAAIASGGILTLLLPGSLPNLAFPAEYSASGRHFEQEETGGTTNDER